MNFDSLDVAKYVIVSRLQNPISNLELQKTLYYIQGYFLRGFGKNLFKQGLVNWRYGPVNMDVYFNYNHFVADPIYIEYQEKDYQKFADFLNSHEMEKALIDLVIEKASTFSHRELVAKTHLEDPWKNTDTDYSLSELMEDYFLNNDPLSIFLGGKNICIKL